MKLQTKKVAFTLIELLVVITIIGILAVWATTIYTAQIQKARDTTRINDTKALQSAIEQVYQDNAEYPHSDEFGTGWTVNVRTYMERIPSDPKTTQQCNSSACDYLYVTWPDNTGIEYWEYELSTWFENDWNVSSRWAKDGWNDNVRLELWIDILANSTTRTTPITSSGCLDLAWASATGWSLIKVANFCNQ